MSTIKDVAKLANVSVTTVSRVLNNNGYVHENTKKIISKAISDLNYMSNSFSNGNDNTNSIGIIINNITSNTTSKLLEVLESHCQKNGYKTIVAITRDSISLENYYYELFKKYDISGIFIIDKPSSIDKYLSLEKPIVCVNNYINENISSICVNHELGASYVINEFKNNNRNFILVILFDCDYDKTDSFIKYISNEIKYKVLSLKTLDKELISKFLLENDGFDGVFTSSDLIAISTISLIHKMNISIPHECSIISYDNSSFSNVITPTLSSIDFPIDTLGIKAFNTLNSHIKENTKCIHEVIDIELIKRESTTLNK